MKKDSWLKTAEYAALAGSALGTVAAAISSQATYAAAPLTLALSLNLINRTRLEKQAWQRSTIESAQVHQLVESLHNQVTALPSQAVDLNPIYQAISQLNNNTQSLVQHYNARPEIEQIQELKEVIASYPLELNELQSNIQKLAQQFNSRSEIEQIQELKEAIASLPNPLELNELQNDIQKLAQRFNARPEIAQIQELKEAIAALPHPLELNELQNDIQKLSQQFNARPETKQIQELREAIAAKPNPLEIEELQQQS